MSTEPAGQFQYSLSEVLWDLIWFHFIKMRMHFKESIALFWFIATVYFTHGRQLPARITALSAEYIC